MWLSGVTNMQVTPLIDKPYTVRLQMAACKDSCSVLHTRMIGLKVWRHSWRDHWCVACLATPGWTPVLLSIKRCWWKACSSCSAALSGIWVIFFLATNCYKAVMNKGRKIPPSRQLSRWVPYRQQPFYFDRMCLLWSGHCFPNSIRV